MLKKASANQNFTNTMTLVLSRTKHLYVEELAPLWVCYFRIRCHWPCTLHFSVGGMPLFTAYEVNFFVKFYLLRCLN